MAFEYGFFWDSNNGDRKYNAASFEQWLKKFFTSGVFTGDLQVTANGDMTVNVSEGYANVNGKVRFFDMDTTLSIATADNSLNRIDTVVIERNNTNRSIELKLVTGTPSANPVAPSPVRGGNVHQLVLAQITVPAGAVKVSQTNIKDTREDLHLCGLVTGTVKEMDVEHLRRQFDAICDECEVEFETWFEGIKNQLSTDAAGNLQNQIDGIKGHRVLDGGAEGLHFITTDAMTTVLIHAAKKAGTNLLINTGCPILNQISIEGSSYFDFPATCDGKACFVRMGSGINGVYAIGADSGIVTAAVTLPTSLITDVLID